jgi:hypothetical protein
MSNLIIKFLKDYKNHFFNHKPLLFSILDVSDLNFFLQIMQLLSSFSVINVIKRL